MRILLPLVLAALAMLAPRPAHAQQSGPDTRHVRVHAHIVLLDRAEARRVGLRYLQVGGGRIRLGDGTGGGRGVGAAGEVAGIPVSAFLDLARRRRLVSSETQTQVLALSGSSAAIGSATLSVGPWASRAQGPELVVTPTVLEDGRVQLDVRVRLRDEVRSPYGHGADASPVDAATTLIVRPGQEATLGSVRTATESRDAGLLHWQDTSGSRDVLVVLRPEIVEL